MRIDTIAFFTLLFLLLGSVDSLDSFDFYGNPSNVSLVDSIYVSLPNPPKENLVVPSIKWEDCFDEDGDFLSEQCEGITSTGGSSPSISKEIITGSFGTIGILVAILASISKGELKRIVLTITAFSCFLYAAICFFGQEGVSSSSPLVGFNVFITLAVFLIESPVKGSAPVARTTQRM